MRARGPRAAPGSTSPRAAEEQRALLGRELEAMQAHLASRPITALLGLPTVADPAKQTIHRLLADMTQPASALGLPVLGPLTLIMQINLAVELATRAPPRMRTCSMRCL